MFFHATYDKPCNSDLSEDSEDIFCPKAIDDKLEWIRTKAGDERGLADQTQRGLRKVPGSGNLNATQSRSGYMGSGKVSGVMVPSAFGTQEMEEDAIPRKQIKIDGTVTVVSTSDTIPAATSAKEQPMAV